jgi:hypothetical protein
MLSDAFIHEGSDARKTPQRANIQWVKNKTGRFSYVSTHFQKWISKVTGDFGWEFILVRELDEHLGMGLQVWKKLVLNGSKRDRRVYTSWMPGGQNGNPGQNLQLYLEVQTAT